MSPYVDRIVANIREAEAALTEDVRNQQRRWQYRVHRGRVWFDEEVPRPIPTPHSHYQLFFDYGDAPAYHRNLATLRRKLRVVHRSQTTSKK